MTKAPTRVLLDALNDALKSARDRLYALDKGVKASVKMCEGHSLVWDMDVPPKGVWDFYVVSANGPTVHILSASAEHRIFAAVALPKLAATIDELSDQKQTRIRSAIEQANSVFLPEPPRQRGI